MALDIRPETEAAIQERIESGQYRDADEVIRSALKLLDDHEFRALVAESRAQFERGEYVELTPAVWDEIERAAEEKARTGAPIQRHVCP